MTVSTIECGFCDVEFDVMYTEEAEIKYCPFCGEDLEEFDEDNIEWDDNYEWEDEDQVYTNPWIYQGEIFDENLVDKYYGMVYCITCPDSKKYIGRKTFWFMRKLRGAKRRSKIESDWRKYYGSSEIVKEMVKELGEDNFKREILSLHKTKGEMNYTEVKEQFQRNVLESNEYINDNINGKYFKSRVEKWNG